MEKKLSIYGEQIKERLDKYILSLYPELSRSAIKKMIEEEEIIVNGKAVKSGYALSFGDRVEIFLMPPKELAVDAENIPLDVVFEDDDIIVVNKPKGMVVHPACGNPDGTLVNALLHHCRGSLSGINGVIRPGIVHRIDKDTSGLIVVAKNDFAHLSLAEQIKVHSAAREYIAVTVGVVKEDGIVDAPIGRNPKDRKKMAVTYKNSKEAITHYKVLESFRGYSFIECRLETGRTHQIRVHMAHINRPLLGDELYGGKRSGFKTEGQMLHAIRLKLKHPRSGEEMVFETPIPSYFEEILARLREI